MEPLQHQEVIFIVYQYKENNLLCTQYPSCTYDTPDTSKIWGPYNFKNGTVSILCVFYKSFMPRRLIYRKIYICTLEKDHHKTFFLLTSNYGVLKKWELLNL